MKLRELLASVPAEEIHGDQELEIESVACDSRRVRKGSLFVAIGGFSADGHEFIESAVEKGAVAVVTDRKSPELGGVTVVRVTDARESLALLAGAFHGCPASEFPLVGVTGTSGKTTTTKMVESILDATGEPVGLIGTIEYRAGDDREIADRTTPDAVVLQEWLARMREKGVRYAVMEVSSHALALKRTHGIPFAVGVFTNLSREHFDFHSGFEDYYAAKRILFEQIDRGRRAAVVNLDDEYGRRLATELGDSVVLGFGRSEDAAVRPADDFEISIDGLRGRILTPEGEVRLESVLLGLPNLYNWMAAIGAARLLGIAPAAIEEGARNLRVVPGRFERVSREGELAVIVDYAHKPDALEKLLRAVRELAPARRLVLVFGCGGDRDRGKRAQMGEIAGRLADRSILTSDNPRSEEPEAIVREIERGLSGIERANYEVVVDRRKAIETTILEADEDAVVVIAGKGHENYQVLADRIIHFDDREEARLALEKRDQKAKTKETVR